ncbi:MAG TPA: SurA N-terminal domain-containing protein [Polyangia bacterium]|nr:SurA N-terminal domain-containing protein [Polyangia bacterium]
MLSVMRQHSRSLLIYILFGIVIAVFIINFGPGSKGCGTGIAEGYAAKIAGFSVPEQDFVHAFQLLGYDQEPADQARARGTRTFLMELLIRRELLAQEGERLGFRISEEEIGDRIEKGRILVVGVPRNITMDYRFASIYKDGFDYQKYKQNFLTYFLHTTDKKFMAEQRRELLAEKVKELVRATTKVGPDEVKRDYIDHETQVKLQFVRFGARRFEDETELAPSDVATYLKDHKDKIKEAYEARSFMYKAVPKEARLRVLLFQVGKDAPAAERAKAEGRARAALDRLKGGTDFAKVAHEMSDDKSKARGGDVGWKRRGAAGFGAAFDDQVFALAKGASSEIIKTERGLVIARVEDFREGDLPLVAVEKDLAEEMLRKDRAAAQAKKEAEAALSKLKAGAKLEDLFPKQEAEADEPKPDDAAKEKQPDSDKKDKKAKKPVDPNAPKLQETGMFARHGNALEDIGVSKEATKQVFGPLKKGELAGPFEIQGGVPSYVILKVVDRKDPDLAAFEAKREDISREVAAVKWATVLNDLAHRRCIEVRDSGKLTVNPEILSYGGEEGVAYTPCTGFGLR